jgi:4-hydroxy-tetrahydrodipicolinate synthase
MAYCHLLVISTVFHGCLPALMTPCDAGGQPSPDALVASAERLMRAGMTGVVYCGSMGDWPLLAGEQRRLGVESLVDAGIPVVVGTGAPSPAEAAAHAAHAQAVGAAGLMVIPRVLSRGSSPAAQRDHFAGVLGAAPSLPSVIYNSPYYGFETRADLFFELRRDFPNLVGYKEFGGRASLSYAAQHITSAADDLTLVVGVDTEVVHGIVNCGAAGVITGIGNVLPEVVLRLIVLSRAAATGDPTALTLALDLERALGPLAEFDEGPDLVLYYKHLAVLAGDGAYEHHVNPTDVLTTSQRRYAEEQFARFGRWWSSWEGRGEPATAPSSKPPT